ncbi:MAG: exonuclease [Paracoccaceae bacterium]|nr:MAG: exonuclease [Paracoccaceae bacterium]
MKSALVFDCEFLSVEGAPSRFWCGPLDPDPVVAQIGAVRIGLDADFPVLDTLRLHVIPRNRYGDRYGLDPFFTRLTGITEDAIDQHGVPLDKALEQTMDFASGARLWSWGKDEFNMVAISCYVEGLRPPIPATQFGNACQLFLKAGMPYDDIKRTRSNSLAAYYRLDHPPLRGHDALDDALCVAYAIQHLLRQGSLDAADFD